MRSIVFVAIGVLTLTPAATAQNQFERQVRNQLDRVSENLAKKGYRLTTQVYTGELNDERNEEVTVRLRAGVNYAIVGVCDTDCDDLDIVLYNANGREIVSDVEDDDHPVVEIRPDRDGTFSARAVMANCKADPCAYGLGLYSSDVDIFEQQIRTQLDSAAGRLRKDGYELTQQVSTGDLRETQFEDVHIELDRGRTYIIVGVCDNDCKDVDLRLSERDGREIDKDVEHDDYPTVSVTPQRNQRFTVRTIMATCNKQPCRYGFGVFAR
jgi:hypothetical protein